MAKSEFEQGLNQLEAELKQLEAEYNMYFAGRLPKPPFETRARVAALVKKFDRAYIQNTGDRFRFTTLQTRFATLVDLWDRGLRAREEGRSGPFVQQRRTPNARSLEDKVVHTASFRDPVRELDKLTELYESLSEARRAAGEDQVPFHKFAEVVKGQVQKLRNAGGSEVSFRVAVKDGKVNFTARALKNEKS
ncbi:MAG TPA: MXAN_5187 C-terminal domain-containing protein [Vicinamibacterales bacterium]